MSTASDRISDSIVEIKAIAWKELVEFRRQPGVLFLVVLGPFLVLAAFGIGYRNEELSLRTIFVGPADSPYEEAVGRYTEAIDDYVVPVAFTTDLFAATEDLRAERADLIVVLPPDVAGAIEEGRRSEIAVLHNSIDPIERIGIEFAAEVAVRELNATVVTSTLEALLSGIGGIDEAGGSLTPSLVRLETAVAEEDDVGVALAALELRRNLERIEPALEVTFGPRLTAPAPQAPEGEESPPSERSATLSALVDRLDALPGDPDVAALDAIRQDVERLEEQIVAVLNLEAELLARPFSGDAEPLLRQYVSAEDHIAPGATALLIQHLAVSLAALSLVRDERRGIMNSYRIGPTTVTSVILGKVVALSSVASLAAVVLVGLQVGVLGVPSRGPWIAVAVMLLGLVVASAALGLFIASVFRTELFASQAAMISLLVALFFSGFLLDLDRIIEPFRSFGLVVPSTPAVEGLRNVQLRGLGLSSTTVLILAAQTVLGLAGAATLISRRWRSGS